MSNGYPKWVQRAPHVGAVLCLNADEEKTLLDDFAREQAHAAKVASQAAAAEKAMREAEVLAEADAIKAAHAKK